MEVLLAKYRGKCAEENAVRELLEKARFDTQQLRIRLRSSGIEGDGSLIPSNLRAGGVGHLVDSAFAGHKSLLEWLAEVADASHLREFYAPGEVAIGDLQVTLGRMVQLRLSRSTGVVKLNVPVDFVHEFLELLSKVRRGDLRQAELGELAAWKLVSVELTSDGDAQPAIFLIHPVFSHAVVVSSWPTLVEPTAMQTPCPATVPPNFHPEEYFGLVPVEGTAATDCQALGGSVEITFLGGDGGPVRLTPAIGGGIQWSVRGLVEQRVEEFGLHFGADHQGTITGPFGPTVITSPSPGCLQRELVRQIIAMATDQGVVVRCDIDSRATRSHAESKTLAKSVAHEMSVEPSRVPKVSSGDRVEVEYHGEWIGGVLHDVDDNVAHVRCDVDGPNIITLAHISNVRPVARIQRSHVRSKSWACP
eukprot:TRINITY_DN1033_c0_g1_i1.p1 TRINITY_DN1033_c0_g1~~TRINITY_DN1033_c0_g1_i1.p1  ORF type:complete len:420 (-),score=60.08 TRINITY_DN1033_c0_g1_i1:547-1806(-)